MPKPLGRAAHSTDSPGPSHGLRYSAGLGPGSNGLRRNQLAQAEYGAIVQRPAGPVPGEGEPLETARQ